MPMAVEDALKEVEAIQKENKNLKFEIIYSESIGDKDMSAHAWKKHGFGIFTNSLSNELITKNVDIVVHSFKDLPVKNTLKTSFITLERDDPRDVVLIKNKSLRKKSLNLGNC